MHYENGAVYMVYDVKGVPLGELRFDEAGRELWPEGVHGWTHALDCTIEPYAERTLEENCTFAKYVHKHAVVVKL